MAASIRPRNVKVNLQTTRRDVDQQFPAKPDDILLIFCLSKGQAAQAAHRTGQAQQSSRTHILI